MVSAKLFCYTKRILNKESRRTHLYDNGDPPQCANSKAISIWLISFGLCVKYMTPLLMLIDSSNGVEMLNRIYKNIW
jgi:hypothetical protein